MVAPAIAGIDLFKIAGRSIAGWIPSFKTGAASHVRQPFCSQLEERLLLWVEYHPQVACYASVAEVASRLAHRWPATLVEAAIWKVVADAAAAGHLLVDLEQHTLDRQLPLALLPPDAPPLVPAPLPDTLLSAPDDREQAVPLASGMPVPGPTFDASTLPAQQRDHFYRNWRAVTHVLAGAPQTRVAAESGIPRSTLGRLVRRTRALGQIACVPRGTYARTTTMHPAFQERLRRLYVLPTRLSMTAIHEHTEMRQVAARLAADTGQAVILPSYDQVRRAVHRLTSEPDLVAVREGAKAP